MALAWCFEDEQTPTALAVLDRVTEQGGVASQLWPAESLNGLLMAERRGRITTATRQRLARLLQQLPIAIDDETAARSWTHTQLLASQHRLTVYDASYLERALRLSLPLGTRDAALIAAAKNAGAALVATA